MKVGVIGGGQLARMMAQRAHPLGLELLVVDPEAGVPASRLAPLLQRPLHHPEAFAALSACDVVTYESESVPLDLVQRLETVVSVHPRARVLELVRDRLLEKRFLQSLDIPTADFRPVSTPRELRRAVGQLGLPAILKTRFDGYDGKGQQRLERPDDVERACRGLDAVPYILEAFVDFDREVSLIAVRDGEGRTRLWSPAQNVHRGGILRISRSPAEAISDLALERAGEWIARVGVALDYCGVFAIEFFCAGDHWIANEMAPRVHNSGHWTIEGAETCQFENHLRAITGLPLGSTESRGASAMINLIGSLPETRDILAADRASLHLYGKSPRPGRKLGHITLQAPDAGACEDALRSMVHRLADPETVAALRAADDSPARPDIRLDAIAGLRTRPSISGHRSSDGSRSDVAAARSS